MARVCSLTWNIEQGKYEGKDRNFLEKKETEKPEDNSSVLSCFRLAKTDRLPAD